MSKCFSHIQLTETLGLSVCLDGFWLYDKTRGMNLAMRAESERAAFIEALEYYQKRLKQVEQQYAELNLKVESFVAQVTQSDD